MDNGLGLYHYVHFQVSLALLLHRLYVAMWDFLSVALGIGYFLASYREGTSREVTSLGVWIDRRRFAHRSPRSAAMYMD
jgi:hypothetical protein